MNIIFKGKVAKNCKGYKIGQTIKGNGCIICTNELSYIGTYNKNDNILELVVVYTNSITQEIAFSDKKAISKIEEKFNSDFTKSDLITGDVILRRNGSVEIICLPTETSITPRGFNSLNDINENLTSSFNCKDFDIIAVRRPTSPYHCQFNAFKQELGELVYTEIKFGNSWNDPRFINEKDGGLKLHFEGEVSGHDVY